MNKPIADKTIIIYNSVPYFIQYFEQKGFNVFGTYRPLPLVLKVVKHFAMKLGLPKHYWFDRWKSQLDQINTVIFFAGNSYEALTYITEINPKIRIIYYYWNPVFPLKVKPKHLLDKPFEIWTFDPEDRHRYKLRFNSTFYFDCIQLPQQDILYDVCFIGVDKGRRKTVEDFFEMLASQQLKTYTYIVDSDWNKKNLLQKIQKVNYNKPIQYSAYLEIVSRSRCILDYVQEGQSGLTLRVMESIFLNKKLITSDTSIANYDFYNSENIFILGKDCTERLAQFIQSPYVPVPHEVTQSYDVIQWFTRFFNSKIC
ncbi:hypothetical protein [Lunatimonas salinarum]|uniref:hypothetical protein n=1 Tax=Lunatimonas salinarum TaxID=1774590 RepID=UPI001ADF09B2|nr:hypothetical protein [Lunatimonas salinarum]